MLASIAIGIIGSATACAVAFVRRAPAVSFALLGLVAAGAYGFYVSAGDGPRGVPGDVAVWASCGLGAGGLIGLAFASPRASAASLRRSASWFLALAPLVAAIVAIALRFACPLYVTERARYCYHSVDVLGGWITSVTMLVVLDMLTLAVVCLASSRVGAPTNVRHPESAADVATGSASR
jgi:hypothetical protein